jgi:hypothetical protein
MVHVRLCEAFTSEVGACTSVWRSVNIYSGAFVFCSCENERRKKSWMCMAVLGNETIYISFKYSCCLYFVCEISAANLVR